jgi:hypothetical protein
VSRLIPNARNTRLHIVLTPLQAIRFRQKVPVTFSLRPGAGDF